MKKIIAFVIFSVIFSHPLYSQTFDWAHSLGTSVLANAKGIAAGEGGDIYLCGDFMGLAHFGSQELRSEARDGFLVKFNSRGEALWARKAGSVADDFADAVALDKKGNCIIAGSFSSLMFLGHDTMKSAGQSDIFVAKYSATGDVLWSRSAGGKENDHATSLSTDKEGNIYVAGYFKDTMRFGDNVMIHGRFSTYGIFFAKYDSKGNVLWARALGGANYYTPGEGLAIVTQPDGATFLTGFFQREAIFGSEKLTNNGTYALFLTKYDTDGKMLWVKSSSKDGALILPKTIALDKNGNSYIGGTYTATAVFDTISVTSRNLGNPDLFLAKYNSSGRIVWLRSSSSFGTKMPYDIVCDKGGDPVVTGMFRDSATFGTVTVSAMGKEDFFVVKYSAKGDPLWAKQGGMHGANSGRAVASDKSSDIFIAGNFMDTADFGKISLIATPNTQDIFIAKLSPRLIVKEKKLAGSPGPDFQFISCTYNGKTKSAVVKFSIPKASYISLRIYSEMGETAESYLEGQRPAGIYEEWIDMKSIPTGEYYCRLQAGSEKGTKKIIVK